MTQIDVVAFDADDTLWHNENLFVETRERFTTLLADYHSAEWVEQHLNATEMRNLEVFGYGIKGFTLSMIETAVELTEGRVSGRDIATIMEMGRSMLSAPVKLLDGVREVVEGVAERYRVAIVTKGDLFDQETKLARSGLGSLVHAVEVVSDKTPETYRTVLDRLATRPTRFVMVGNSMRSDIVPVAEIGGYAIHVPYRTSWAHEEVPAEQLADLRFLRAESLEDVPDLLSWIEESPSFGDLPGRV